MLLPNKQYQNDSTRKQVRATIATNVERQPLRTDSYPIDRSVDHTPILYRMGLIL
jgi:hypothetical protein